MGMRLNIRLDVHHAVVKIKNYGNKITFIGMQLPDSRSRHY
jgi:hypothetical protein